MTTIVCPNCGADLTTTQSVRIAEHFFGKLEKIDQNLLEGPGFTYKLEQSDTYTILCNTCKRLVRKLPMLEKESL